MKHDNTDSSAFYKAEGALKNYLKKGKDMAYEIGDEVYWTDPDEGIGSGWGKVADRHGRKGKHQIYILKMRDGGEVECFRHELS